MDKCTNFIIGGTIKAATSSIFTYLNAHSELCGSSVKETFFFTRDYTGKVDRDMKCYMNHFKPNNDTKVLFEASPNYLGYKENIAARIRVLLPDAKLLFILRNPVDRFYSYYNFAMGKQELPQNLKFEVFADLCEQYSLQQMTPEESGIAEKHLRALEIGKYSKYLQNYFDVFHAEQIKVVFYDDLKRDPVQFMADICDFIDVNPDFYREYTFNKVNVTFSGNVQFIHRIALMCNRVSEKALRHRPGIKKQLVKIYKQFNQRREGYAAMKDSTRKKLVEYYAPSNKALKKMLSGQELPVWVR